MGGEEGLVARLGQWNQGWEKLKAWKENAEQGSTATHHMQSKACGVPCKTRATMGVNQQKHKCK